MSFCSSRSFRSMMPVGVVAGRTRRRSGIVEESLRGHRQGSATARRYGISRSLLTRWRKDYRLGLLGGVPAFSPVRIAPEPPRTAVTPVAPTVPRGWRTR